MIFKKIAKRDSTTKIKGLEEFKKEIENSDFNDSEKFESIIRWCTGFWKLAEDSSPKVRILSARLMGIIGGKLKRYVSYVKILRKIVFLRGFQELTELGEYYSQ